MSQDVGGTVRESPAGGILHESPVSGCGRYTGSHVVGDMRICLACEKHPGIMQGHSSSTQPSDAME